MNNNIACPLRREKENNFAMGKWDLQRHQQRKKENWGMLPKVRGGRAIVCKSHGTVRENGEDPW